MANGKFELNDYYIDTTCEGGDKTIFGIVNDSWVFYDEKGKQMDSNEEMLKVIETTQANGDFSEMLLRANKIQK